MKYLKSECSRCGGKGEIPQYKHRDAGLCYWCKGVGKEPDLPRGRDREHEKSEPPPLSENEKRNWLLEIKTGLVTINQPRPRGMPQAEFEYERNLTYEAIAYAYYVLMKWGYEFSERVRARIRANMTDAQYRRFETAAAKLLRGKDQ